MKERKKDQTGNVRFDLSEKAFTRSNAPFS